MYIVILWSRQRKHKLTCINISNSFKWSYWKKLKILKILICIFFFRSKPRLKELNLMYIITVIQWYQLKINDPNISNYNKHDTISPSKELQLPRWMANILTFDVQIQWIALSIAFLIAANTRVDPSSTTSHALQYQALITDYGSSCLIMIQRITLWK